MRSRLSGAALLVGAAVVRSVLVMQGGRQLGMEAQPELYVAGVVAVLAIAAMEYAGKAPPPTKAKRR
jgi:hypothetical protein